MSFFIAYLVKFSISLAAVYLFYRFILRPLTFYNWNRWYLMGYTFLSFFIAAINITPLLRQNELAGNKTIQWVPSLDLYGQVSGANGAGANPAGHWSAWDWTLFILLAGAFILSVRLFIQYLSFLRIRSKAELVSGGDMQIYQVEGDIIPFSFGNSIFINRKLHTEEELQDIIRHEFVHVKQRHSIDIVWCELLCIINWYNPFAWFLRQATRQNLEFIADQKVVSKGVDKKQYQYLLLKVIGNNHFSIAPKFNFSSLKKRIAMMNKLKSAKVHLLKFLFLLPVAVVMLLAFRNKDQGRSANAKNILQDTIPANKIKLPEEIESIWFMEKENANSYPVNKRFNGKVVVKRKDGTKENYDFNNEKSLADFKKKYGVELGDIFPPAPPTTPMAMVEPQRTVNNKGYLIDIVGIDGTCTVLVKDKDGKELERITLDEWKENGKYEELYGEILPPPSAPLSPLNSIDPISPVQPATPVSPLSPLSPLDCSMNPLTTVAITHSGINLSGISREYEITDKKATLKLLDGTIENYDLTNKKEREVFEKKYGKIIHVNTNVNTTVAPSLVTNVNANLNTTVKAIVNSDLNSNINTVITIPSPKAANGTNLTTSTVAPVAISHGVVNSLSSTTPRPAGLQAPVLDARGNIIGSTDPYSNIITGKEDIIITITKNTTRQELDKFILDMRAKGVDLDFVDVEYNEKGKLVNISGNMRSGGSHSNFNAYDFDKVILAMIKKGDKTYFKVSVKDKEVI